MDLIKEKFLSWQSKETEDTPAQTITDVDDADDIALKANTPAQTESLPHNLQRAAVGIGLHINVDKTEYMFLNQRGDISTLKREPLKLVDKLIYLVSWSCWIYWLNNPPPMSVLYMTLKNLMVRFQQCLSFEECRVPLHCHCSQVHSGPEW